MTNYPSDAFQEWQRKVKLLCANAWQDAKLNQTKIDLWLENFVGAVVAREIEHLHAFHLLQQFIYFGQQELNQCLEVLFRDHYVYPFVQHQKAQGVVLSEISARLDASIRTHTRFVAVGGPAESGQSFLYQFRKANDLPMNAFATDSDVVKVLNEDTVALDPPHLQHLIYLDDFCGTGQQVQERVEKLVRNLRKHHRAVRVSYYLLFATEQGITNVKEMQLFNDVAAAITFDSDYRTFGNSSHYYREPVPNLSQQVGHSVMATYGARLFTPPLGYGDCQLMVGFHHNTPDNTLPVFWAAAPDGKWQAIFPRANKF